MYSIYTRAAVIARGFIVLRTRGSPYRSSAIVSYSIELRLIHASMHGHSNRSMGTSAKKPRWSIRGQCFDRCKSYARICSCPLHHYHANKLPKDSRCSPT